jgi:hypothetical protein
MLNKLLGKMKHNLKLTFLIFIIEDNDLFFLDGEHVSDQMKRPTDVKNYQRNFDIGGGIYKFT